MRRSLVSLASPRSRREILSTSVRGSRVDIMISPCARHYSQAIVRATSTRNVLPWRKLTFPHYEGVVKRCSDGMVDLFDTPERPGEYLMPFKRRRSFPKIDDNQKRKYRKAMQSMFGDRITTVGAREHKHRERPVALVSLGEKP